MSGAAVLFDAPGPRARVRNNVYAVAFVVVLIAIAYLIYTGFDAKGQWAADLWSPFLSGDTWTEFLLPGLIATIQAAIISVVIALPLGALLGIGRMSTQAWIRRPCDVIVEFFRAIPVLLLMVFAAEFYSSYTPLDSDIRPLFAVVTGLVLYNGSVIAEIVRSGIKALPRGQSEAADALGFTPGQRMRLVLLPQAVTLMLPALISQLVVVLKDTALGGQLTIGYIELIRTSNGISSNFGNAIPTMIVVGALYILMNWLLTSAASALQRRLSRSRRKPPGVGTVGVTPGDPVGAGTAPA